VRPSLPRALAAACLLAAAAAGTALADDNAGFGPVEPESPNADRISDAYWLIFAITAGIFVIVAGALVLFIIRFRSRGRARSVDGPQIRGNTNLEIAWTVVPVLILAAIVGFVLYQLPGIQDVPSASAGNRVDVRVTGRQYYWQFDYPGGAVSYDRLVVPVDRVVYLTVVSPDVIHSWWIPSLGGKIDAIPGRTNHTWFQAKRPGVFRGQCAELCGLEHASMRAVVEAVSEGEYRRFLASHRPENAAVVGHEGFESVCAKCHGPQGEGDYGVALRNNPILSDTETLESMIRGGRRVGTKVMPAVGADWSDAQMQGVVRYLQQNLAPGQGA
jgi:cytochrome c oxidase subunit 2